MKKFALALIVALGLGFVAANSASAAPAAAAPISQAAGTLSDTNMQQVWYDRYGRWHPNRPVVRRGPPVYVAPPVVVSPRRAPVCRTVWSCNKAGRNCRWVQRCR